MHHSQLWTWLLTSKINVSCKLVINCIPQKVWTLKYFYQMLVYVNKFTAICLNSEMSWNKKETYTQFNTMQLLFCYCGQTSLQCAAINSSFSVNLTPLGVLFILLAMIPFSCITIFSIVLSYDAHNMSVLSSICSKSFILHNFSINTLFNHSLQLIMH